MQRYSLLIFIVSTQTNAAEILAASAALQKQLDDRITKEVASLQGTTQISPAVGQAIASVGDVIGGSVGRRVTGFATVGASLYSNMKLLSASPAALASMGIEPITLGLSLFSGVCSLIGMFNDDDDELAEALNAISQQLSIFHRETMESFERLEEILDIGHRQILAEFLQVHKDHKNIKQRLKTLRQKIQENQHEILDAIQSLRRDSIVQHKEVINQFAEIHLGAIQEKISDVMAAFNRGEINGGNLAKHIHELQKCICIIAKNRSLTGSTRANLEESATDVMRQWFTHPAFDNINIIKEYYTERFGDASPSVVNPFVFTQCTDVLIELLNEIKPTFASEQEKTACIADVDIIIQEALQAVAFVNKVQEPTRIAPLVDDCVTAITTLQGLVETKLKTGLNTSLTTQTSSRLKKVMEDDEKVLKGLSLPFETLRQQLLLDRSFIILYNAFQYNKSRILWRGKPIVEDQSMYQWAFFLASNMRESSGWVAIEKCYDAIIQRRIADYQTRLEIISEEIQKPRRTDQPASMLIHPLPASLPNNKQVIFCNALAVNPLYIEAEKLGLGKIRTFYRQCATGKFEIQSYFGDKIISYVTMDYDLPTFTDGDIINFWDGGRYLKTTDVICLKGTNESALMIPSSPYSPARDLFTQSPKTVVNQDWDTVRVMIVEKLKQERIVINQDIIKDLKLAGSPMAKAVEALNRRYTMFEAVCALAYNQQFATSPLARHVLAADVGVITDKKSFVAHAEQYAGEETYAPFSVTLQRFAEIKKDLAPAPFPMLVSILARLRDTRSIMDDARIVPVAHEADGLRQEVASLREQMRAQSEQIAQLLKLLTAPE